MINFTEQEIEYIKNMAEEYINYSDGMEDVKTEARAVLSCINTINDNEESNKAAYEFLDSILSPFTLNGYEPDELLEFMDKLDVDLYKKIYRIEDDD